MTFCSLYYAQVLPEITIIEWETSRIYVLKLGCEEYLRIFICEPLMAKLMGVSRTTIYTGSDCEYIFNGDSSCKMCSIMQDTQLPKPFRIDCLEAELALNGYESLTPLSLIEDR